MMKKNGFTLAEVLITLAIIGVVATLTLPALMTNTGEQQYVTGLKKGINTLTEAAQMSEAVAGFNYGSLADNSDQALTTDGYQDKQSLFGLLATRASVDFVKTGTGANGSAMHAPEGNHTVFLRDGSAIMFNESKSSSTISDTNTIHPEDGLPHGISIIYDVNGSKGPNIVSNCDGHTMLTADNDSYTDANKDAACADKTKRIIRDQFGVRLRGSIAVPNGSAARWAFGK